MIVINTLRGSMRCFKSALSGAFVFVCLSIFACDNCFADPSVTQVTGNFNGPLRTKKGACAKAKEDAQETADINCNPQVATLSNCVSTPTDATGIGLWYSCSIVCDYTCGPAPIKNGALVDPIFEINS